MQKRVRVVLQCKKKGHTKVVKKSAESFMSANDTLLSFERHQIEIVGEFYG